MMIDDISLVDEETYDEEELLGTQKPIRKSNKEVEKINRLRNFLDGRNDFGEKWDLIKQRKSHQVGNKKC